MNDKNLSLAEMLENESWMVELREELEAAGELRAPDGKQRRMATSTHWAVKEGYTERDASRWTKQIITEVDNAWRRFWLRRGRSIPPRVSARCMNCFTIPSEEPFPLYELRFGDQSKCENASLERKRKRKTET